MNMNYLTAKLKSMRKILLIFAMCFTLIGSVYAQQSVTGTVTDTDGLTLPGVSVVQKGTSNGTITGVDGKYSINVPSDAVITFSFIGMETIEMQVNGQSTINVTMSTSAIGLEEVVVTALGIAREERELGYAMTQIDGRELTMAAQVNPVNTLQGKTSGVQISTTSGGTFGGSRITIRGNSTFSNNTQPIFVVDGVVMDNDLSGTGGSDWGNQLKNLNPDDFESFSILKGAAATALYGSRAINGVVMITTKSGSKGAGIGVDVSQTFGMRYVYDTPDFQNEYGSGNTAGWFSFVDNGPNTRVRDDKHDTQQFFTYDKTTGLPSMAFNSWEEHAASWGPKFDGQEIIDYDGSRAFWVAQPDNFKDSFDKGLIRNTNVAVSGGGANNSFRMSFSNSKETGVTPRNDFGKNSVSIKGTQDLVKDKLTVGGVVHYTRSDLENPVSPGDNSHWFHDGFPRNYDVNKWRNNYTDVDGGVPFPAGSNYNYTRMSQIWMGINEDENLRTEGSLVAKGNIDFAIAKGLRGTVEGYLNQFTVTGEYKTRAKDANRLDGAYGMNHSEKFQNSFSGKLFYENQITNDLQFDMVLGAERWKTKSTFSSASTNGGFKIRDFYDVSNSKNAANGDASVTYEKDIQSVYGYFNFAYKRDIYLNATFRRDWSSALVYPDGRGEPGFTYPSASLSWVLSETLTLPAFVSFAKLRASYAIVGNDTDPYRFSTGFTSDNFSANPNLTMFRFSSNSSVSPNLVAEKKHSFETGLDIRMLGDRVGFDFAYYKDNNKNQIISLPVPGESGIGSTLINAGNLQNSGVEISADVTIVENKNWSWDIGVNYTHNVDKIIDLAPGITEFNLYGNPDDSNAGTASYAYVGGNYGDLVTRRGYDPYEGTNTENHGIPLLANRNGWSIAYPIGINNKDSLHVMGNMQPDWYGGMHTSVRYKRIHLSAIIDARFGGEIYSADARYGLHQGVLESSLPYRDESQGGIVWTSKGQGQNFYGKSYQDGYIPHGVFPDGTTVTSGPADNRTSVNVGGMTYQQAYDKGLVEPTHWSGYIYRWTSASTGTPITGVYEQSWIGLREVSISYSVPRPLLTKLFIQDASLSLTGRDLGFLYNSMPDNINPTISNNAAANPLQMRSSPYIRSITFAINLKF
jgi:iron complex outermembrane receptor protein